MFGSFLIMVLVASIVIAVVAAVAKKIVVMVLGLIGLLIKTALSVILWPFKLVLSPLFR